MLKLVRASLKLTQCVPQKPPSVNIIHLKRTLCSPSTGPDFAAITNGDAELEHKLKVLALEVEVMRQEGRLVPEEEFLKTAHWQELLTLPTLSARRRYLQFLFKNEKSLENKKAKIQARKMEREATKPVKNPDETLDEFAAKYDLQHNNLFLRFYDSTMNQFYNNRLIQAVQFGQKIVVDCGYHENMNKRENQNCAKQIMLLFSENRYHDDPYDLHLCNADPSTFLMEALHRYIMPMYEPSFPINVHQKSYLELFPKEQLVYLTPHCRNELIEYDHDAVYIIGGIVDKMNNDPLSLARAKRDGLKMAKLPLDKYLCWGDGAGKSLTLNQTISIMLDVKKTGDWQHALRHVPKRKLMNMDRVESFKSTNAGRFKRTGGVKSWSPNSESFRNLKGDRQEPESRERMRNVKSIMYD